MIEKMMGKTNDKQLLYNKFIQIIIIPTFLKELIINIIIEIITKYSNIRYIFNENTISNYFQ